MKQEPFRKHLYVRGTFQNTKSGVVVGNRVWQKWGTHLSSFSPGQLICNISANKVTEGNLEPSPIICILKCSKVSAPDTYESFSGTANCFLSGRGFCCWVNSGCQRNICDVIWKEKHAKAEVIIVFYKEHLDSGKLFYKCLLMLLLCPFLLVLFELGSVRPLLLYRYRGHDLKHVIKKSYIGLSGLPWAAMVQASHWRT